MGVWDRRLDVRKGERFEDGGTEDGQWGGGVGVLARCRGQGGDAGILWEIDLLSPVIWCRHRPVDWAPTPSEKSDENGVGDHLRTTSVHHDHLKRVYEMSLLPSSPTRENKNATTPRNGHVPVGDTRPVTFVVTVTHFTSEFCGWSLLKMDEGRLESKRQSARGLLDSLTLPRPSTSLTPLRPSTSSYRPQWSSSPPTSPSFGPPKTPDMRHSTRPAYRLPSFKATFGRMSFDPHLSDDEVPPSSDFGCAPSEYDYSDPGTPDDRLPSVPVDSPPPEDVPFDPLQRAHRLSVSSEHEEEAILALLDLRRRPRVSSFASDRSAPDLLSTISPETENDPLVFPMTPDRSSMDPVDRRSVKIEEVRASPITFIPILTRFQSGRCHGRRWTTPVDVSGFKANRHWTIPLRGVTPQIGIII